MTQMGEIIPRPFWVAYIISHPLLNMNNKKTIGIILAGLVVLNILDGSFTNPGLLDWIKAPLFILCFVLLFKKGGDANDA